MQKYDLLSQSFSLDENKGHLSHFTHGETDTIQETHKREVQVQGAVSAVAEDKSWS
jgi:hypothetical protein